MKIGNSEKYSIRRAIIRDIYETAINKLSAQKSEIVKKNHEMYLDNINPFIINVPNSILVKGNRLAMEITNSLNATEVWNAHVDKEVITPGTVNDYGVRPIPVSAYPVFQEQIIEIDKEYKDLSEKKEKFDDYLEKVFAAYSGPVQLRKVLPEYLHKYIPVSPPRKARAKQVKPEKPNITAPDFVKEQLVENMLENN